MGKGELSAVYGGGKTIPFRGSGSVLVQVR